MTWWRARRSTILRRPRSARVGAAIIALTLCSPACVADDESSLPTVEGVDRRASVINGFNYPVWAPDGYERPVTTSDLDEIVETGAAWVVLSITWYQDEAHASCPGPVEDATVRIEGLRRATRLARDRGLQVAYKPMVDLPGAGDRSAIDPLDPTEWFRCYALFIDELTTVAATEGVGLIEVGTELGGTIRHDEQWRAVIAAARKRFDGLLTYGANFDDVGEVTFWDDLDLIGVSAYWPLARRPTTDAEVLGTAWRPIVSDLSTLSARWDRPILLTELGYRSQVGVTVRPWDWTSDAPRDEAEQAAAFDAARRAFSGIDWFGGVLIWTWDDVVDSAGHDSERPTYSPNGTASLAIIEAWFAEGWAG